MQNAARHMAGLTILLAVACGRPTPQPVPSFERPLDGEYAFSGHIAGFGDITGRMDLDPGGMANISGTGQLQSCTVRPAVSAAAVTLWCGTLSLTFPRAGDDLAETGRATLRVFTRRDIPPAGFDCAQWVTFQGAPMCATKTRAELHRRDIAARVTLARVL